MIEENKEILEKTLSCGCVVQVFSPTIRGRYLCVDHALEKFDFDHSKTEYGDGVKVDKWSLKLVACKRVKDKKLS